MPTDTYKRKLTAILSADVAGYSRLMDNDEVFTVRTLQAYQKIISDLTEQHNGRVVDSPGDNVMAAFESVVDAVQCAIDIQQVLKSKNDELPESRRMLIRIGINLGDVIEENGRIYGDGINIAARVESLAEPGGICISGRAYDQVENKIDLQYENLGEHRVKNIRRPIRVYKIPIEIESDKGIDESILDSIIDLTVPTDKPSIAVLPFVNMSGDPEQEYFSDGMTEAIITALAKVPDMLVIARNSTFVYKGMAVDVKQVAKGLGVKYVLEGSVQKAGNRIRLTAQLIDAETENHLWAERYDRDLEDVFTIQDELTLRIVSELQISLTDARYAKLFSRGTNNLEAFLKYRQAMEKIFNLNKTDNFTGRKICEEVIKLDSNSALGYAGLSFTYLVDYWGRWSNSPERSLQLGVELTEKTLSLDDSSAFGYQNMSFIHLLKRNYDESIAYSEMNVFLHPSNAMGYDMWGYALIHAGKPNEAIELCKKAIRISPFYWVSMYHLGMAYCDLEKYDDAINAFNKAIDKNPNFLISNVYLTATYSLAGMEDKANSQANEVLKIDPQFKVDNVAHQIPYKNQSDTDRILNALRKAGLK